LGVDDTTQRLLKSLIAIATVDIISWLVSPLTNYFTATITDPLNLFLFEMKVGDSHLL
jgi:hypothetical protein